MLNENGSYVLRALRDLPNLVIVLKCRFCKKELTSLQMKLSNVLNIGQSKFDEKSVQIRKEVTS